tara:strand:+ start:18838 stop:19329 length:492 start_codon:yes stop_codon:yes gene_type:complete
VSFRNVWSNTIWAKGALDHEPKKYRSLKRVWLPIYDSIAIVNGLLALWFGSSLLDRIFGGFTDVIGVFFALVAFVCLLGVAFPALWKVEVAGKVVLIGMVLSYVLCILIYPSPQQLAAQEAPNFFVAGMLVFGLPLAIFRLDIITREEFERRVTEKVSEIQNA